MKNKLNKIKLKMKERLLKILGVSEKDASNQESNTTRLSQTEMQTLYSLSEKAQRIREYNSIQNSYSQNQ